MGTRPISDRPGIDVFYMPLSYLLLYYRVINHIVYQVRYHLIRVPILAYILLDLYIRLGRHKWYLILVGIARPISDRPGIDLYPLMIGVSLYIVMITVTLIKDNIWDMVNPAYL